MRIICESTSGYHQRLLRLARAAGCRTALVSGEQVKQLQVVENNDTGKSDHRDPRTMMLLVKLGKTLVDRGVARKFLKLIFGLERSKAAFDPKRVFTCASRHDQAAA